MNIQRNAGAADLERVAGAFRAGEHVYAREGSPLYANLARAGADDPAIVELAGHGMAGAPPVHLFTSVHFMLLGGLDDPLARFFPTLTENPAPPEDAYPGFRRFCLRHYDELKHLLQTRSVQMTYPDRCRNLVPPLSLVADLAGEPLNLIEIGCSAGVLLVFDRYAYELRGDGERIGPADAPFVLQGRVVGGPALRIPQIGRRTGIDLNLIDPRSGEDRRWMLATCFPELLGQQARLAQAMDIVAETDIRWLEGDALLHLPQALAETPDPVCVYHSACLMYWPAGARAALRQQFIEASRARTIYRVGIEPSERLDSVMRGAADGEARDAALPSGEVSVTRYRDGRVDMQVVAESSVTSGTVTWPT
ncbi:MAG: DUF2332 domain-containing protein [Novosphingobium sp.]|jgi:hypothetical protein|nr:DUF2332 domain-containing protein [Novosphingobium sp.]